MKIEFTNTITGETSEMKQSPQEDGSILLEVPKSKLSSERAEKHRKFMEQCFLEANNIMAQSLPASDYDEKHAQGFREGYWMAKWLANGLDLP
jgi:hypothetical protein